MMLADELTTGALPTALALIALAFIGLGGFFGALREVPKSAIAIVAVLAGLVTLKNMLTGLGLFSVVF